MGWIRICVASTSCHVLLCIDHYRVQLVCFRRFDSVSSYCKEAARIMIAIGAWNQRRPSQCRQPPCVSQWYYFTKSVICYPEWGRGTPFPPLLLPCPFTSSLLLFINFSLFPFLVHFTYFLLLFIRYQNRPTPFPRVRSQEVTEPGFSLFNL